MRLGRLFKFIRTTVTNKLINSVFDTIILSLAQVPKSYSSVLSFKSYSSVLSSKFRLNRL